MATFRDPVSRDRAWAKHYARSGLRLPATKECRSMPNAFRLANYRIRRAKHEAALDLSSSLVKC